MNQKVIETAPIRSLRPTSNMQSGDKTQRTFVRASKVLDTVLIKTSFAL